MSQKSGVLIHCLATLAVLSTVPASAEVRITEIMFHPPHADLEPEPVAEEFIEITNTGLFSIDLTGAEITAGVSFAFPGDFIASRRDPGGRRRPA